MSKSGKSEKTEKGKSFRGREQNKNFLGYDFFDTLENAMRRVLEIGNCDYDHQNISNLLKQNFQVEVTRAHGDDDALVQLERERYDLVLVNRVFEEGGDGLTFIRQLKQHPQWKETPVMLISNYPDSQQEAVSAGALPGFGKRALSDPATVSQLSEVLAS